LYSLASQRVRAALGELDKQGVQNVAIAKFTHSGSQIIDWIPAGSEAKGRNLYLTCLEFVRRSVQDLRDRGHEVVLAGEWCAGGCRGRAAALTKH